MWNRPYQLVSSNVRFYREGSLFKTVTVGLFCSLMEPSWNILLGNMEKYRSPMHQTQSDQQFIANHNAGFHYRTVSHFTISYTWQSVHIHWYDVQCNMI